MRSRIVAVAVVMIQIAAVLFAVSLTFNMVEEDIAFLKFENEQLRDAIVSQDDRMIEYDKKFKLIDAYIDGVRRERDNAIRRY